jgi:hypothetical protein
MSKTSYEDLPVMGMQRHKRRVSLVDEGARRCLVSVLAPNHEEWQEMRLDPEEQIIAAVFDETELDDTNERGVGARIEFRREGRAKVTITISRELAERARELDLTTGELFAEAVRIAAPGAFDVARPRLN